ncbi:MAG: polysaccharide lyase family 7 protein [Deltaproteobacteria bacterium]|nr:polysaccharide lyase family 7 protein [Deltaproteobacteria bacterium]
MPRVRLLRVHHLVVVIALAPGCDTTTPPIDDAGTQLDAASARDAAETLRDDAFTAGDAAWDAATSRDAGERPEDAEVTLDAAPGATLPAELLDLSIWKLTLPIGPPEMPMEITQPELATYEIDPWFVLVTDGVQFRANAGGVTTSGSSYPRSELREMEPGGSVRASWSTSSGRHEMRIDQSITHLPEVKPHVVAGQIHDASDDVVMIRLEGTHLFVEGGGEDLGTLDADYTLGDRFVVRIVAEGGHIRVDHGDDGTFEVDVERAATGCYFKAGVYTQSNVARGDDADAYGEVIVHALDVTHTS